MDISPDEEHIVAAIRAKLAPRLHISDGEAAGPIPDLDLGTLEKSFDPYDQSVRSQRTWTGALLVICRRVYRKLLAILLQPQMDHNAALALGLRSLWNKRFQEQIWQASDQIDHVRQMVRVQAEELEGLRQEIQVLRRELVRQGRGAAGTEES